MAGDGLGAWADSKHPRDDHGRFTDGGGSDAAKAIASAKMGPHGDMTLEERTSLKPTIDELRETVGAGKLKPGVSAEQHVKIAQDFLAKHAAVTGRVKDLESTLGKLSRKPKYGTADHLQDGSGMRVVAKNIDDVKATVAAIKAKYNVVGEDNYIDKPLGPTEYRSHHLIVKGKDGLEREIQVRTPGQNAHADWAHNVYKPHTDAQKTALKENAPALEKYARDVGAHFFHIDSGKEGDAPAKPPCPPIVRKYFGCL